ncbi:efflux RND transporter permease subunit [Endozoicomonas lisbonensis]|uniref:Hydrophobe/amphiphile efflux-1 (HAE1) family protein n=1 Tax=Endozoicomonas lisbonensis TaxID=3120522 RepID=A0ABV2SHR5_9GAMM
MILSDLAIKRPVVACVINLLLIVFGILAFNSLPLREYPDVSAPVVSVAADYDGASADIMESRVAKVIEDQLSGIRGVRSIDSMSSDGRTRISIEFENDRDIEAAANDVRDAVSRAKRRLPENMDEPTVSKSDSDGDGVISFTVSSDRMSPVDLSDYINRQLLDPLSLIDGVSSVELWGYNKLALLVKLDPVAMASRNVTVTDIEKALRTENLEAAAGSLTDPARNYTLRLQRSYQTVADYQNLVIRRNSDGSMLYLSDIARVETGSENEDQTFRLNNRSMVMLEFLKQSEANTLNVVEAVKEEVERLKPFLPEGMEMKPLSDSSVFIKSAISEVYTTLGITSVLVILVIYIFLGSTRATLIPAVSVPISLIATFAVLLLFDYSINLITLLALVLSVGLLVDDSIVVLENIHSRIEKGESPIVAAYRGTREVGMAVVATTMVLVAVFMPITLLTGTAGMLFKEYAVTLAASVFLSSIVALTMGPVLGSRVLKLNVQQGPFTRFVERQFNRLENGYRRLLNFTLKHNWIAVVAVILSLGFMSYTYQQLPQSFVSREDQGRLFVRLTASEGASYHALEPLIDEVEQRMEPLTNPDGPIQSMGIRAPARNQNEMFLIIDLKPWDERDVTVFDVGNQIRRLLQPVAELRVSPIVPSSFGTRARQPVQVVIGGGSYEIVQEWVELLKEKASENPGLRELETDYNETTPRMNVTINQAYAHELGIPVSDVSAALETVLAGRNITTFIQNGEEYDVNVRAPKDDFNAISDLARIHLRSASGELVRLDTLIDVTIEGQPRQLNHYNRRKSITLSADLVGDYSLGEALAYIEQLVIDELPDEATIDYKGESMEYKRSSSSMTMTFILALVVVYLVLAAQFESFVHPMVIMMTVPLALTGAMGGMLWAGLSLDIYTQISLIMLIGLATKNGILIVEFINQLRDRKVAFEDAIIQGSVARLRPILMTAITTLAGSVPLILASGAGYESRTSIGIVIFSGVLVATFMTLFVAPGLYRLVAARTGSPKDMEHKLEAALENCPAH